MNLETAKELAMKVFPKAHDYSRDGEFAFSGLVVDTCDSTPEDPQFIMLIIYDEKVTGYKNRAFDATQPVDAEDDAFWPTVESMTEEKWLESLNSTGEMFLF